jgi:hypothetical protein
MSARPEIARRLRCIRIRVFSGTTYPLSTLMPGGPRPLPKAQRGVFGQTRISRGASVKLWISIGVFWALTTLSACKSQDSSLKVSMAPTAEPIAAQAEGERLLAAAPPASALCDTLPSCPEDERQVPYQCIAYRYGGQLLWEGQRLHAWGASLCQAQRELAQNACKEGKDLTQLGDVSCAPDPTMGSCPAPASSCPDTAKPSKCYAKTYKGQELGWEQRPTAWGRNECEARSQVAARACEQGLEPGSLGSITCEIDVNPGQCPPTPPDCPLDQKEATECLVSQLGDIVLKKPWKRLGPRLARPSKD